MTVTTPIRRRSNRIQFPNQPKRLTIHSVDSPETFEEVRHRLRVRGLREISDEGHRSLPRKLALFIRESSSKMKPSAIGIFHEPSGNRRQHNQEHFRELMHFFDNKIPLRSKSALALVSEGAFDAVRYEDAGDNRSLTQLEFDLNHGNVLVNTRSIYLFTRTALKKLGPPTRIRTKILRMFHDPQLLSVFEELNQLDISDGGQYKANPDPVVNERVKILLNALLRHIRHHAR